MEPLKIDSYDNSSFIYASQVNDIELIRTLLQDSDIDPSAYDNQAYYIALSFKYYEIVDLLTLDPRVINSLLRDSSHIIPLSPEEEILKNKGWKQKNDFDDCIPRI